MFTQAKSNGLLSPPSLNLVTSRSEVMLYSSQKCIISAHLDIRKMKTVYPPHHSHPKHTHTSCTSMQQQPAPHPFPTSFTSMIPSPPFQPEASQNISLSPRSFLVCGRTDRAIEHEYLKSKNSRLTTRKLKVKPRQILLIL